MGEQEVIMTKLALSVTLVALGALTASSTSNAPRAGWNPSADVAALLQTSADTAGEVKLSSSGAATYAMGIPQTGPGGYGTLPSATIPGSLPPANHPPVLGSPLLYGKDYVTPVNSARAQYPRTQWYSWPIVQAAWVTTNWYKMSTQLRKDQIAALKFHAEEADKNAVKIREARLKVVRKLIENTKAQISALATLREETKHPSKARAPPHPINPYTTLPSAPAVPVNTQVDALARLQQQEDYMVQFSTSQVHVSNTIEAGHRAAEKGYIDALEAKYADENKAESDHVSLVVKEAKQQQADIVRKTKQEQKMLKDELATAAGEGDAQADDESQSSSKTSKTTSSDAVTNNPNETAALMTQSKKRLLRMGHPLQMTRRTVALISRTKLALMKTVMIALSRTAHGLTTTRLLQAAVPASQAMKRRASLSPVKARRTTAAMTQRLTTTKLLQAAVPVSQAMQRRALLSLVKARRTTAARKAQRLTTTKLLQAAVPVSQAMQRRAL